jgi:hypothetical protein
VPRVWRILPPVRELVGVRIEDGVQAQRLHGAPWGCRHEMDWELTNAHSSEDSRRGERITPRRRVRADRVAVNAAAHRNGVEAGCTPGRS